MAQLRALIVLAEDLGQFSTLLVAHDICDSNSGGSDAFFWPLSYMYIHTGKPSYTYNKSKMIFRWKILPVLRLMITFMLVLSRLQEPSRPLGRVSLLRVPYDLCKSHLWLSDLGWFPVGGKSIQETHCRVSWLKKKKNTWCGLHLGHCCLPTPCPAAR